MIDYNTVLRLYIRTYVRALPLEEYDAGFMRIVRRMKKNGKAIRRGLVVGQFEK